MTALAVDNVLAAFGCGTNAGSPPPTFNPEVLACADTGTHYLSKYSIR